MSEAVRIEQLEVGETFTFKNGGDGVTYRVIGEGEDGEVVYYPIQQERVTHPGDLVIRKGPNNVP
jgi:hypothetical protein